MMTLPLALAACGSPAGSHPPSDGGTVIGPDAPGQPATLTVSVDPPVLTASYRGNNRASGQPHANFHLGFSTPPSAIQCVQITADGPVLNTIPIELDSPTNLDAGSCGGLVEFNWGLAPGQYNGTLTFHLFKDVGCSEAYSLTGNEVGYALDVVAPATLSAMVDGVPTSLDGVTVPNGSLVEFDVSEPATISWGSSGVIVDNEVKTSTSWQGVMRNGLSSGMAQFTFSADVVADPPQGFGVTFTVAP